MKTVMYSVDQVASMLAAGKQLLVSGDAQLLAKLPRGQWIGGSTPYFMAENGGVQTAEKLHVCELPPCVKALNIRHYDAQSVENVYVDMYSHGFSFVLIPAFCATHEAFALHAPSYQGFASQPLLGWIAGVALSEVGKRLPVVFDGASGRQYTDDAVVMHVELAADKVAQLDILNIFEQGDGDVIEFLEDGFEARQAVINGQEQSFADYLRQQQVDLKLPLVADYAGAMINTSFQNVDAVNAVVTFYAPVFRGAQYRVAKRHGDYLQTFIKEMGARSELPLVFSCNCILNYLYAGLEGRKTGAVTGPITFGEIAYQLLNQTMVYLTIADI